MEEEKKQFAVLIDADNISSKYAASIFNELDAYGFASCRRIYGNWSKSNGWSEEILLENSIIPIQQFSYTSGKNSTDMAMVIDAMDLLYSKKVDGFCLVTSDSDFTRLAMRLREEKMYVIGMGESKTPISLTKACNRFIHLNLIAEQSEAEGSLSHTAVPGKTKHADSIVYGTAESMVYGTLDSRENVTPIQEIGSAINAYINEKGDEPAELAGIGSRLNEKFSDFDVRNYGYTKLRVFVSEEFPKLEVIQKDKQCYVRKRDEADKSVIIQEIIHMIEKNGGVIDNLSVVLEQLKGKHPNFDLKDYGYSRLSSFLRSIKSLTVNGNTVRKRERK
ncbi:MAG: NYN domain-containing protein [Clostridiales bacterium]|nr:NYN domain-containing protein [Clostridiales bacterium]